MWYPEAHSPACLWLNRAVFLSLGIGAQLRLSAVRLWSPRSREGGCRESGVGPPTSENDRQLPMANRETRAAQMESTIRWSGQRTGDDVMIYGGDEGKRWLGFPPSLFSGKRGRCSYLLDGRGQGLKEFGHRVALLDKWICWILAGFLNSGTLRMGWIADLIV